MAKRSLQLLCPQFYDGMDMHVTPCTRCRTGWDRKSGRCVVETGAEHLPDEVDMPDCPISDRCRHGKQSGGVCVVRQKGLVCESALIEAGIITRENALDHPLSFNAHFVATPEEVAEWLKDR